MTPHLFAAALARACVDLSFSGRHRAEEAQRYHLLSANQSWRPERVEH
jgi:hypothetical protein